MGPSVGLEDGVSPPKGNCPASTCSPGMRPANVLHQGLVLLKLFPVSLAGRSRTTGSLPQGHPNTSPTQLTGASTELLYPCVTGVHLPLVGFPLVFLKTKDSICFLEYLSGRKAKLFWGYPRLATGVFVVLILVGGGRREKMRKRVGER